MTTPPFPNGYDQHHREEMKRLAAKRQQTDKAIEYAGKGCGVAGCLGCLGITLLVALTGFGALWQAFTWAWGL